MKTRICCMATWVALWTLGAAQATEWYVGPRGTAEAGGTRENPWDLKSVLEGAQKAVRPGDTVWVSAGTYSVAPPSATGWQRAYRVRLSGTPDKPVIVRAVPGERVTIDGALAVHGHDTWFWGLEITTSAPRPKVPVSPNDLTRPHGGVTTYDGRRCRFINCIVHDNNQGFSWWVEAADSEIYGCLIYRNGWVGPTRGHGHGIYTQNKDGTKRVVDNVIWDGYCYGMQCYGSARAYVYGYHIEGNIFFSNGMAAKPDGCTNFVVGGGRPSKRIAVIGNVAYMHPTSNRVCVSLHYTRQPNADLVCRDNYFVNGRYALTLGCWEKISGSGNTLFGRSILAMMPLEKVDPKRKGLYTWDRNTYYFGTWPRPMEVGWSLYENMLRFEDWRKATGLDRNTRVIAQPRNAPSGVRVFVRPNRYEPGRAHIAVANWDRVPTVAVDLSGVLKRGQPYRIFNVQDLWGDPVVQGVYDGKPVAVPARLSWLAPEFDAYLVLPTARGEAR